MRPRRRITITRSKRIAWRSTRSSSTTTRSSAPVGKLNEMVDRRSEVASYPIERIEVPFDDGKTISCLLHLLPDRRKAPVVIYVPGMDQTKEVFPKAHHNIAVARGFHVCAMDGPGQGSSNMQKIRAVGDNYERAGAAVISYLQQRAEIDRRRSRSTASAWAATGRCACRATTIAPPRRELGGMLQSEQHDLHAIIAALQTDVHVHGGV